MFASAALSLFGLGFLIWVLFRLAVQALPFFVAVSIGQLALGSGAGHVGAVVTALFAGAIALVLGQVAFAAVRSPAVRLVLGALYALRAGVAGFGAVKALSDLSGAVAPWTFVFAAIGGLVICVTAWGRIASLAGPDDAPPGDAPAQSVTDAGRRSSNAWSARQFSRHARSLAIRR